MAALLKPRPIAAAILVLGSGAMLALNWPGQMSWDSVAQLSDGRSGAYNSWHPPVMAFLLGLFDRLLPGPGLYLLFQAALLLAALLTLLWLVPRPGWRSVAVALAIMLTPQIALLQGEIWKDILFANAAIAGFAALALAERHWRAPWIVLAALLLALAAATRQTGVVLLPVAAVTAGLIARRHARPGWRWGLGFLAATLALGLAVTLILAARGDRGEGAAAQIRLAQSYDLAGAYARDPRLSLPLGQDDPALERLLKTRGAALYTPLRNDPLAADPAISAAIGAVPGAVLGRSWQALAMDHPGLYLRVRWGAFRAVVTSPDGQACHYAPVGVGGDPARLKALGLVAQVRPQDRALAWYARLFFHTPVYAHLFWIALALIVLAQLGRQGAIALSGLIVGALVFVLTFVIVSIACDYRYLVPLDLAAMAAALGASGRRDA